MAIIMDPDGIWNTSAKTINFDYNYGSSNVTITDLYDFLKEEEPMETITDPDDLIHGQNVHIDAEKRDIFLYLDAAGVSGQALYSFLKQEWKTNESLCLHQFPMVAITPEILLFTEGWKIVRGRERYVKNCGWSYEGRDHFVAGFKFLGTVDEKHEIIMQIGNLKDKRFFRVSKGSPKHSINIPATKDTKVSFHVIDENRGLLSTCEMKDIGISALSASLFYVPTSSHPLQERMRTKPLFPKDEYVRDWSALLADHL